MRGRRHGHDDHYRKRIILFFSRPLLKIPGFGKSGRNPGILFEKAMPFNKNAALNPRHPFFHFLADIVYPQLGAPLEKPRFRITPLAGSHWVFLFSEETSEQRVIAKYCFLPESLKNRNLALIEREYDRMLFLRGLGFNGFPCRVARPLGNRNHLPLGLVQEWEAGRNLDYFLQQAIYQSEGAPLFDRLRPVGFFFGRTSSENPKWTGGGVAAGAKLLPKGPNPA